MTGKTNPLAMSTLENFDGPHLDVPSTDDLMHLSPDMDRHESADGDIDIDFDIDNDIPGNPEDEAMEEQFDDGADTTLVGQQQSTVINDDEMFDDDITDPIQPDHASLVDENLEDAESPLLDDEDFDEKPGMKQHPQKEIQLDPHSTVDFESIAQSNNVDVQDYGARLPQDLSDGAELVDDLSTTYANDTSQTHDANHSDGSLRQEPQQQSVEQDDQNEDTALSPRQGVAIHKQHTPPKVPKAGDQTASVDLDDQSRADEANDNGNEFDLSTDAQPLHPVVVVYQGNEMSLFPPIDQDTEQSQTYFLDDEAYAAQSLGDLFGHCRSVLGDSISDEEELEIKISDLGLTITETSNDFTNSTLLQILDIFLQLSHHEGVENPDPMYIELCTKYKFAQRLEYLMSAVIDGKGFSQLQYIDGGEGFSGDGDYAQEEDGPATEKSEEANNAIDLEAGPSFNISGEHTLEGKKTTTDPLEGNIHQGEITEPLSNVTPPAIPQHPTHQPTEITSNSDSRAETMPAKEFIQEQPKETSVKYGSQVAIDDDFIDFSDEEVIPEVSARSSTLQGDDGSDEKKRGSPESRHDPEELIDYGDEEEPSIGIHSAGATFNDSKPQQSLNEGFSLETGDSQEYQVQPKQSFDEADDLDHIVDYDAEVFQRGGTYQEYIVEDETALDPAADTAQIGYSELKDVAVSKHQSTKALTSDIDFGDDLELEVDDVAKDPSIGSPPTASHKDNRTHNIASSNKNDKMGVSNNQGTQTQQDAHSPQTSQGHIGFNDDAEDFLFDSDDEIRVPDHNKPVPKSAMTPPSLKRLRDSHDEENLPSATSPDMKRIRST